MGTEKRRLQDDSLTEKSHPINPSKGMVRAFVAIDMDQKIRENIARVQKEVKDMRPVRPENIHFTLLFLGETPESAIPEIKARLGRISFESFEVTVEGMGAFPRPSSARTIWAGVDPEGGSRLVRLACMIRDELPSFGRGGTFRPHATIFRIKNKAQVRGVLERFGGMEFGVQRISSFKLKKSVLSRSGSEYSDIMEVYAA